MSTLLGCMNNFLKRLKLNRLEDRPIGLRYFQNDNEIQEMAIDRFSKSGAGIPPFKPSITKKALSKAPPAFAYSPPSQFNYQDYRQLVSMNRFAGFPRR